METRTYRDAKGLREKEEFPRIETASLRDKVVEMLKGAFFSGKLRPGDRIVERQLAREMNVGIHAIREALITLQEKGFVTRVANTATYVNSLTPEQVKQLYALRTELELLALRWAKPNATESDLTALEGIIQEMTEAASQGKAELYYECDLKLHRRCWSLSGNEYLCHALESEFVPLIAFITASNPRLASEPEARKHLAIVNALRHLEDPEFSSTIRSMLSDFAMSGITAAIQTNGSERASPPGE